MPPENLVISVLKIQTFTLKITY